MKIMDNFLFSLTSHISREDCFEKESLHKEGIVMTSMQVEYSKLIETQKHNRAMEEQASRELDETILHNRSTEQETAAHNRAMEQIDTEANSIKREANAISVANAKLNAFTSMSVAELNAQTTLQKQQMINNVDKYIADSQLAEKKWYDQGRLALDRAETKADLVLKNAQTLSTSAQGRKALEEAKKVKADADYTRTQIDNYEKEISIKQQQAQAASQQAKAALQQASAAEKNAKTNAKNARTNEARQKADADFQEAQKLKMIADHYIDELRVDIEESKKNAEWFGKVSKSLTDIIGAAVDVAALG